MNTWALSRNGYANAFYSAGVKSMLLSLHNFLYLSADPGGLISIDKPPLSLWLQVASAKLFGFTPLSLLLPEAIAGVLCVWVLYLTLARSFGRTAGLIGAACLAVFPAFVAVSRDNNPDALLILLMTLSCLVALAAIRSGRLSTLLLCALILGLAFNVKTLACLLVVPGIALAHLLCAPGSAARRLGRLAAAGLLFAAISLSWITFVELTPASQRPYVGSSMHNSELGLTFDYNGFGRLDGQLGGPESIPNEPGAYVPLSRLAKGEAPVRHRPAPHAPSAKGSSRASETLPDGRASRVTAFAQPPGPLRLLEQGLGSQGGWLLPLAVVGLIAAAIELRIPARPSSTARGHAQDALRRDPRLAGLIVLGGWFVVEAVFLSVAKGIVHPYYTSALGPGAAAAAAVGLIAFARLIPRRSIAALLLLALGLGLTAAAQIVILHRDHYMAWLAPLLVALLLLSLAGALAAALRLRRVAAPALALALGALLIAPTAYSAATSGAPVQGTFPAAGPRAAAGYGGLDLPPEKLLLTRRLFRFLSTHQTGSRFSVLTVSSVTAAPLILLGSPAASLAGYSGDDPALSAAQLAKLVARREARYVLLGGPYSTRGGNEATRATLAACRQLPSSAWGGIRSSPSSYVLFDCASRARQIAAAHPTT